MKVTANDFHLKTRANFQFLKYGKPAFEMFKQLSQENGLFFKSPSGSEYVVCDDTIYRLSDHWGKVASCKWNLIDAPGMPVGSTCLASCKLSDFEDMKKPVEYVVFTAKNVKTGRVSQYAKLKSEFSYEDFMINFKDVKNFSTETHFE